MTLAPGTRIGPYEITARIGAGGMGEVYRARDTTLDRDVAIKVLPELLASDPERVARFSREAKTLASLNHPNIAHIHGVLESPFGLVMEFVDGEELAQRLARGAIPLEEAIPIATQIAEALACAHDEGVVHRDLKPANIKVRSDGAVKVLDFGLAKALGAPGESSVSGASLMLSPTFTSPAMTNLGVILGTAAYMAPEQARGKVVDKRADVWAFGVVLFEMLSGTRLFEGSEVSDTLAFVLTKEPDWTALPAQTPAPIRRLLRRCLQKDRARRLADIADARLELDEAALPLDRETAGAAGPPALRGSRRVAVPAAILAGILLGAAVTWKWMSAPPPAAPVTRFTIAPPAGVEFSNTGRHFIGISRDGARIVYTAGSQLYVRELASAESKPVPGSLIGTAVINPVFSPDGQAIAFYADNTLRRIPVAGGTAFTMASGVRNPHGLFWSEQGIFAAQSGVGIIRVPETGEAFEVVAKLDGKQAAHGPHLIDDDTLIFTVYSGETDERLDKGQIVAQSLRTGQRKVVYEGGADGLVLSTGYLTFSNGGVLYAVPFDQKNLSVTGTPKPMLDRVRRTSSGGATMFRAADNGTIIYQEGASTGGNTPRGLGFLDRSGKLTSLNMPVNPYEGPRLSPDGARLAVSLVTEAGSDIWIQDLPVSSALRRLTFGGRSRAPVWSPDGKRIAFQSSGDGGISSIYVQDADVSGSAAEILLKGDRGYSVLPTSWRQGLLAFTALRAGKATVEVLSLVDHKVTPVTVADDAQQTGSGSLSPDGRWIAYTSFAGPAMTTFVAPFPTTGAKYQIGDGTHPLWNPSGRELLVNPRSPTLALYNVTTAPRVTFGLAANLERGQALMPNSASRWFDFSRDGKLLVVMPSTLVEPIREIHVILNWFAELQKQ